MSINTLAPPALAPVPLALQHLAVELEAYYRALPRLIEDGEVGRHAVVKGDQLVSTWDTYRDALQFGSQMYGVEPFLIQPIDLRYEAELARYFGPPIASETG